MPTSWRDTGETLEEYTARLTKRKDRRFAVALAALVCGIILMCSVAFVGGKRHFSQAPPQGTEACASYQLYTTPKDRGVGGWQEAWICEKPSPSRFGGEQ